MLKPIAIILMCVLFLFITIGCDVGNKGSSNPGESNMFVESSVPSSSGVESENSQNKLELDTATKEEYYAKYIKPLALSQALRSGWDSANQLFDTEVQMVGYLVQGFSTQEEWNEIWEKWFSKDTSTIYIPQDVAEPLISTYFNLSQDTIRELSRQYNSERKVYEYYGARDSGLEDVNILGVEFTSNTVLITCEFILGDDLPQRCELEIQMDNNGGYKYISNRLL